MRISRDSRERVIFHDSRHFTAVFWSVDDGFSNVNTVELEQLPRLASVARETGDVGVRYGWKNVGGQPRA